MTPENPERDPIEEVMGIIRDVVLSRKITKGSDGLPADVDETGVGSGGSDDGGSSRGSVFKRRVSQGHSFTLGQLSEWLARKNYDSPELVWDREHRRALLGYLTLSGERRHISLDTIAESMFLEGRE